jgi:hypothetical protein
LSGQCIHHFHLEEELVDTTSVRKCKKCNRTISSHFLWLNSAYYHLHFSILCLLNNVNESEKILNQA